MSPPLPTDFEVDLTDHTGTRRSVAATVYYTDGLRGLYPFHDHSRKLIATVRIPLRVGDPDVIKFVASALERATGMRAVVRVPASWP
ncbi:MAG TPA: hypothetical protein VE967_05390 [Gemmatimonadaceae bacterium]|nr:hypothetical protein [Gemmatimonadaceae bacterium]